MALYLGSTGADGGLAYIPWEEITMLSQTEADPVRGTRGALLVRLPGGQLVELLLPKYRHALTRLAADEAAGRRTVVYP